MNRREFLKTSVLISGAAVVSPSVFAQGKMDMTGKVMTVTGPIDPADMGFVLTHEHVLVDFIGADKVSKDRYDEDDAYEVILPYLKQAKELGCETFVECSPSYLGKDPVLLKRLSDATGVQMLTNTGYYGAANDKYVPAHAYEESADQLSDRWVKEWGVHHTKISII